MTLTRVSNELDTTYSFVYVAPTAEIDNIANCACHEYWLHGKGRHGAGVTYDDLTLAEKLAILDDVVSTMLIKKAEKFESDAASRAAQDIVKENYSGQTM